MFRKEARNRQPEAINNFTMLRNHCTVIYIICILCLGVQAQEPKPNKNQAQDPLSPSAFKEDMFSECGGVLKDPRGVISTPNFPEPFPVPIRCRWVIEAPSDKAIAVHFTQFYLREGMTAIEYAFYSDTLHMGEKDLGQVSADAQPTVLVSSKPVLVLDLLVRECSNVHLRVREHLLDVFGFNVTYEVVARNETVKGDACLDHCSYSGECLAARDFGSYGCRCFGDHHGAECQYSPGCEPGAESTCLNGGTCRHLIGSTIKGCECPSGYEGPRCEKRKEDKRLMAHCLAIGCSHTCGLTNHGDYKCTCLDGYHLSEDKKTCVEKGRIRYLVSFKLYDQNVDLAHLDTTRYTQLKKGIESALLQLFQPKLYKVENMTVLNFQPGAVVQFHFFGEQEDSAIARSILEEALKSRSIGKYAVDRNYVGFEAEPALSIYTVESSSKMPVVAGSELSLACLTQGSSAMRVDWFKDRHPIDLNNNQHLWTTLVPKNSRDQYTAVLGFDKAHPLDSGEFTCQVTDWGTVHSKSIRVSVASSPEPKIVPLTATVTTGVRHVITCYTENIIVTREALLGYNWLKNGRILNPSVEPELVEDLFPGGSRLVIQKARASATYSCIVNSVAGGSRKDATVTVVAATGNTPICQAEKYQEVQWSKAAVNTEDIQFCPKGYTGEVRRHCALNKHNEATWTRPDYSGCLSSEFLVIKEKFDSLRLGYPVTNVSTVLRDLRAYVWGIGDHFHVAEGEPVVDLLAGIHDYMKGSSERVTNNNSQVFLDIVSFLLESPHLIRKQSHVLELHEQILSHGLLQGSVVDGDSYHTFHRSALALEVGQIRNNRQQVLKFPSRKATRETKGSTHPVWLTDSVELDFNAWAIENLQEVNDSISVAVVFYKNLSAFLPERFQTHQGYGSASFLQRDTEYQFHSRIVAVAVQTALRSAGGSRSPTKIKVKAKLAYLDHVVNRQIMWNISCGVAEFSQGNVQFSLEGCHTVQTENYSLCQCNDVGTYAVLLTTYAQQNELLFHDGYEVIAGVGCALCAFFVFLTFFILLVLWRKISGAITAMKLQICLALIGAYATILKSLHESLDKEWYPWCVVSIQFFLLAAFSLQLCLALTVHLECNSARGLGNPELKLAALGWAFPMIVVGATLAAQLPDGFRLNSWWIQIQSNYFYAFSIAAIIITVLHIMLVTTVKAELNYDEKLGTLKHSRSINRSHLLNRSLVVTLFLLLVSVSSIMYVNFDDEHYKYAFSSSSAVLGLMVFFCYTVCSENAHSLCFSTNTIEEEDSDENEELRMKARPETFQDFLKPEIMSDTFYGNMKDAVIVNGQVEKLKKQRFPLCHEDIEWKEVDRFLVEKSSIVHDFTVHHQRSPLVVAKASEAAPSVQNSAQQVDEDKEEVISPLRVQQMDDSPRGSQMLHFKDPDGQEDSKHFYELGNHPPHNTPPDILEPTKQAFFSSPNHQKILVHPCLTTFVGEQCIINTDKGQPQCEGSYSTFRPPANPEDDKIFLQSHFKSSLLDKQPRIPDIGDESLVTPQCSTLTRKKEGAVQVVTAPDKEDPKKGWSITTV